MTSSAADAVTLINAKLRGGEISTLRIAASRIVALGEPPRPSDRVVDLGGDRLLPGLINAHDHLQLNNMPRLEPGAHYRHVRDWIGDITARRRSDAPFEASVAVARDERLLIGGMKNLLSGVTTVAHHDPLYPFLSSADYPTGIVAEYGWSHSIYLDGEENVRTSYRCTPPHWPWIIHAAEGLDEAAANEFECLDEFGCLGSNTLIVHGVALNHAQRMRLDRAGAGLIWCPSSNLHLFGKTADVRELIARRRVALGTDSRLSGARDLLDELRLAGEVDNIDDPTLESLVTDAAARLLRLKDRGVLEAGAFADLVVLPTRTRLSAATRADVRLVMREGAVLYGDPEYVLSLAPAVRFAQIRVDGRPKVLHPAIAALLLGATTAEHGLEFLDPTSRAA